MMKGSPPHETGEADGGSDAEVLVPFREDGDKPPLFFVPAGFGDLRRFGRVAALIDSDRPVFGLRPPSAKRDSSLHGKRVPWIVSMYLAELERIQPTGPYHLAGYSAGGLLSVEVARELIRRGNEVDLLAVLDPPIRIPRWLSMSYLGLYRLCNLTEFTDRVRWSIIRHWDNRLLRWVSDHGLCTHVRVLQAHEVAAHPGRITCICPAKSWIRQLNLTCLGNSWPNVGRKGFEIHWIPGSHYEMLGRRQVENLAATLNGCLNAPGPSPYRRLDVDVGEEGTS